MCEWSQHTRAPVLKGPLLILVHYTYYIHMILTSKDFFINMNFFYI